MPQKPLKKLDKHLQSFEECREELRKIGFILTGSIVKRFMRCGKEGCRCMTDSSFKHGPYYEWTRKVRGKTVSVRLTEEEARILSEWVDNKKRFYELVSEMEHIALDAVEEIRS
jgi:hypothetical protein